MDSASANHYEQQLYIVFKTFDVTNEEALDRAAVLQLCDTLQLEDRGAALVDSLFERRTDRVTFTQFRNGLLSVLGGEPSRPEIPSGAEPAPAAPPSAPPRSPSDDDSSGREVAPKFVFGSKKYGRRSRPQRAAPEDSPRHRVASESRLDCARARQRMRCKRSASAMESRDESPTDDEAADLDHDRRVDRERALALCRGLQMHGVDRRLIDRIFESSSSQEISVGEFFDRLNASLTTSIAASLDGATSKFKADVVSSDAVVEAWERAGVQRPRRLLVELGFTAAALHPHNLECALDDELRALNAPADAPPDARALLLLAALVLARMRSEAARRLLDVARAERDKLRDDLAEANRRARLLAQDVDENHARIEAELKSSLRQMETRHAEAARAAAVEAAADRERAAAAQLALQQETARRLESEARVRNEAAALHEQIEELQELAKAGEARALLAEREQARLAAEAREAQSRSEARLERERASSAELATRLHESRVENQHLRDRNDELREAREAGTKRAPGGSAVAPSWRDEVAMQTATLPANNETSELSAIAKENKQYLSDFTAKLEITLNYIEKLLLRNNDDCLVCTSTEDIVTKLRTAANDLLNAIVASEAAAPGTGQAAEAASQTELAATDADPSSLQHIRQRHDVEKQNSSSLITELESSLEQMKVEYERCEEYWSCKLEDERELFAEEQRAGDERLSELVSKIAEFERQYARPLAPIEEGGALERQFTELEQELAEERARAAARNEEMEQLKRKVEELERRQAEATSAAAERSDERGGERRPLALCERQTRDALLMGALRARAARAERAAHRLHARLAAADLLVKDLYIENCRLAHLP